MSWGSQLTSDVSPWPASPGTDQWGGEHTPSWRGQCSLIPVRGPVGPRIHFPALSVSFSTWVGIYSPDTSTSGFGSQDLPVPCTRIGQFLSFALPVVSRSKCGQSWFESDGPGFGS